MYATTANSLVFARDEDALRNGSFFHWRGKKNPTFAQYMNGDFVGWAQAIPPGLKQWSLKDAKKIIPRNT